MAMSAVRITVFRHGAARYEQAAVPPEEADDLTEDGIETVVRNARALAETVAEGESVGIWSSPLGRALHTAKLIEGELKARGTDTRQPTSVYDALDEVRHFSWPDFIPLVRGGTLTFDGRAVYLDKVATNPEGFSSSEYYARDTYRRLPAPVTAMLSSAYRRYLDGIEPFPSATARLMEPLAHLRQVREGPSHLVIVTHDALTTYLTCLFSGGTYWGLTPGTSLHLESRLDKLVVTRVGELTEGRSDVDVVDAFYRSYPQYAPPARR